MVEQTIHSLETLAGLIAQQKAEGLRVILCHGVFDLLHPGHIQHLSRAASLGDVLIVSVTADPFVNKGPDRPVFTDTMRAQTLAALQCVDYTLINHAQTAVEIITSLKPDVYVKGNEYQCVEEDITGNMALEIQALEQHHGEMAFTDEVTFSSSSLLNEHGGLLSDEAKQTMTNFRGRYTEDDLLTVLEGLRGQKVLVFGDAIIDEYCYSTGLGQVGKSDMLAVRLQTCERFAGGAFAVANHIAEFSDSVTLATQVGNNAVDEAFVQEKLNPSIQSVFFKDEANTTLIKRRYLNEEKEKIFEIYCGGPGVQPGDSETAIATWLQAHCAEFDTVVVPDFGNGLISTKMVEVLCEESKFLAINTQANSGNRGFHVVTRYPRADFISLNEPELRLAMHDAQSELSVLADNCRKALGAETLMVTRGVQGVQFYSDDFQGKIPALSTCIVDRIGAGDAFLALSSVLSGMKVDCELAAFFGSVAAALDVQIVCNREPVREMVLKKTIRTLLK